MTADIVSRLRQTIDPSISEYEFARLGEREEAAAEIERLRTLIPTHAMRSYADNLARNGGGRTKMNKDPKSWARVNPQAVADESRMQAVNLMQMAIEDIGRMAAEIERMWRLEGLDK